MLITRRAEFSASHICRLESLSDSQNRELFGEEANPNGHGHNYVLEVSVEGTPDPVTGMVIDLKELKAIIEAEIIDPMDHRFLNYEVEPFGKVVPTTANLAKEIWRRLDIGLGRRFGSGLLAHVRLFETPDLYVDMVREDL
ncbi:MAG TPA: 6-carboxytetrahydropterin synthase [Bryobacteraceae bacterium]|jgi:6-pyruvoyltetrahydropterin/6-carboxytetrahydropterin synthase